MKNIFLIICLFTTIGSFAQIPQLHISKQYVDTNTIDFINPQPGQFFRTYPRNFLEDTSAKASKVADAYFDTLAYILEQLPNCIIEVGAHSDSQGPDTKNFSSTQKRVIYLASYFIKYCGMDKTKLKAKAYGETQLLYNCDIIACTEQQHEKNRRIEFKILAVNPPGK